MLSKLHIIVYHLFTVYLKYERMRVRNDLKVKMPVQVVNPRL